MKRIGGYVFSLLVLGVFVTAPVQAQWTDDGSVVRLTTSTDSVGIGTASPATQLDVGGWTGKPGDVAGAVVNVGGVGGGDLYFGNTGAGVARMRFGANAAQGFLEYNVYYNGSGLKSIDNAKPSYEIMMDTITDSILFKKYPATAGFIVPTNLMVITGSGRVGIGTNSPTTALQVVGDINSTGAITGSNVAATYQDVAEWVPATSQLEPGTVVILNPEKNNEVMASNGEYDTTVAGVVSAQPGLILGIAGATKEMVATTGRVKVRVDATAAPIAIGDLLVTSGKPGMAMKSQPMKMNGRSFHQPGTIIGKALEPLKAGEGEILVLLSMQ